MTQSEIIYMAWKSTPKPLEYTTADAKGNPITKTIEFADPKKHAHYDPDYEGICNLCGQPMRGGIPVKKMLGPSYMDWPLHKASESTHLCAACAFCLGMNPVGRITVLRYPIVAETTLHLCNRVQLRDWLISPPEPPFLMILPTSQKKHLFAKSRVSNSRTRFYCNLEERIIPVDAAFGSLVKNIEMLRGLGINKAQIETGAIPTPFFKNYGVEAAAWAIELIDGMKRNESFPLALEVAQKMTEEDAKCSMDSQQTTR